MDGMLLHRRRKLHILLFQKDNFPSNKGPLRGTLKVCHDKNTIFFHIQMMEC